MKLKHETIGIKLSPVKKDEVGRALVCGASMPRNMRRNDAAGI